MECKRYIVELGTGIDLHGMDATKAACRAVRDAIGKSCLCGLVEILGIQDLQGVHVEILLACPNPEQVNEQAVAAEVPIGTKSVRVVSGGLEAPGICIDQFAQGCSTILVANAAVTVWIDITQPASRPQDATCKEV